ncbi:MULTISPECIES: hypothetical protein [Calothrix]|uniref:Uncharacterized protein n=2 Tax=Calothrix TaxID=1186 RepID=A0ABR8AM20_9CYAN|nr:MULTISPECIES: hypothetical protein [Calothrix]MBD2200290.1 hypothetical protein [Calothrix parietina FACHB-288]MBD2224287.1 hypothetical protein [Calothrix anomala FACHB-343]
MTTEQTAISSKLVFSSFWRIIESSLRYLTPSTYVAIALSHQEMRSLIL